MCRMANAWAALELRRQPQVIQVNVQWSICFDTIDVIVIVSPARPSNRLRYVCVCSVPLANLNQTREHFTNFATKYDRIFRFLLFYFSYPKCVAFRR